MSAPLDCPDLDCWQSLFEDSLSPRERESYEQHLDSCPACQQRLDQAEACGDALRNLVRRVGDPTVVSTDPTLVQVMERLHEVRSAQHARADDLDELYFLQGADRPGILGMLGDYEVQEVIGRG